MIYKNSKSYAKTLDQQDPLSKCRNSFFYPKDVKGKDAIYLCGNSLGLQLKITPDLVQNELSIWAEKGVLGQDSRWVSFHEKLTQSSAGLVGALSSEVVIMNALTVNIHLLLISFYRPNKNRFKILIEEDIFPSDLYAVESQVRLHGYNPKEAIIKIRLREGERILYHKDIIDTINQHGNTIATIYLGGVNYLTGQVLNMKAITFEGQKYGSIVGFNLAHAAGNIILKLHEWGVDFSAWCTYKYLCAGPGGPSGSYVHKRHHDWDGPRLNGWWGHNKDSRFKMPKAFDPIPSVEAWQISNSPVMGMIPLLASMELYERVGMKNFYGKSKKMTGFLEFLINESIPDVTIITPEDRGCQLSIVIEEGEKVFDILSNNGVICDWREPDVIRVAPHPLFNSYDEIYEFVKILKEAIE